MEYLGKHFRNDEDHATRRVFLKRSLAVVSGVLGIALFDGVQHVKPANAYGSSPYGGPV